MSRKIPIIVVLTTLLVVAASAAAVAGSSTGGPAGQSEHLWKMLIFAGLALGFSFLCSVAEAVLLSISPSFVEHTVQQGKPWAKRLRKVKGDIDRSLAGILTLNTIAHTVGAGGAGAEAAAYFGDRYVGVSMAVLTLLILFLSEIVPKTLGALYWRGLARSTVTFIRILTVSLYPLIWVSERLTGMITRGRSVQAFSREEFVAMADLGVEGGQLDPDESRILKNLFRFPELKAEDIMTPRTVVFALQQDMTVEEALHLHPEVPFSRIPIFGKNRDDITGFVLKTDLLLRHFQGRGDETLVDLGRELKVVAESDTLEQVADILLDKRVHLLEVVDDYGGLTGVVSLEDLIETLIGIEIVDEGDQIDDMRVLARRQWQERMKRLGIDPAGSEDS